MKSLIAKFYILMIILRIICLTSCLKKFMVPCSLIYPGSSTGSISTFCLWSLIAFLNFSAKYLLGLKSNCTPSMVNSMLLDESSLRFGSLTRSLLTDPLWRLYGLLRRNSVLIFQRFRAIFVSKSNRPSSMFLKSQMVILSLRN